MERYKGCTTIKLAVLSLIVIMCLILSLVWSIVSIQQHANAVPSGPSNLGYTFDIEKTDYNPGEIVIITISNDYLQNPRAIVTVKNGMGSDNFENAQILYREEKHLDNNGTAVFKYQIPPFSGGFLTEPIYRYYVEAIGVDPNGSSQIVIGRAFFFTNPEASKIVISDFIANETQARPGGILTFSAKITDGLGKPLPSTAYVEGRIQFPSVDCNMDYTGMGDIVSPNAKGADYLSQYKSTGKVYGWINVIPELYPRDYDLVIRASGGEDKGFHYAEKHLKVHISGSVDDVHVIDVFKTELRSTEPDIRLSNGNHEADVIAGESSVLYLNGFSAVNICGSVLSHYPVSARLVKSDPWIAPTPDQISIENYKLTTDESGAFTIPINVTGFPPGQYTILVDMTYRGVLYERSSTIHVHNVRDYPIHADGQDFVVHVDAGSSALRQLTFDKAQKQITIIIASSNSSYNRMEISVPHGLLNGNFTVLINGKERINDNSWFLEKSYNSTNFSIISMGQDNIAQIDLIGTNVVPEFSQSFSICVIALSITLAFSAAKWKGSLF